MKEPWMFLVLRAASAVAGSTAPAHHGRRGGARPRSGARPARRQPRTAGSPPASSRSLACRASARSSPRPGRGPASAAAAAPRAGVAPRTTKRTRTPRASAPAPAGAATAAAGQQTTLAWSSVLPLVEWMMCARAPGQPAQVLLTTSLIATLQWETAHVGMWQWRRQWRRQQQRKQRLQQLQQEVLQHEQKHQRLQQQ